MHTEKDLGKSRTPIINVCFSQIWELVETRMYFTLLDIFDMILKVVLQIIVYIFRVAKLHRLNITK